MDRHSANNLSFGMHVLVRKYDSISNSLHIVLISEHQLLLLLLFIILYCVTSLLS